MTDAQQRAAADERKRIEQETKYEEAQAFLEQLDAEQNAEEDFTVELLIEQYKTPLEQVKEAVGNLVSKLICAGFVIAAVLFIIGSCMA